MRSWQISTRGPAFGFVINDTWAVVVMDTTHLGAQRRSSYELYCWDSGILSQDTMRDVFAVLDLGSFKTCCLAWICHPSVFGHACASRRSHVTHTHLLLGRVDG